MAVGDDLWAQAQALQRDIGIRLRVIAANVAGAALVALEAVVVGLPAADLNTARFRHDNLVSAIVLVAYLAVAVPVEDIRNRRRLFHTFDWVGERRPPDPGQVTAVFDYPWVQARRIAAWWLGAAVLFVAMNLAFGNNVAYCLRTGLGIVLGGLTSSALSFLLLERFNRPVFALALAGRPLVAAGRLGLQRRLLLIWALGAAVPVLVIVSAPAGLSSAQRAQLAGPVLIVGAIALAVGFGLTVLASRSVTDPIDALRRSQQQVEDGDLEVAVRVDDGGEVGLLQAGFNRMVAGLRERQRIRDLFGRHVGFEVARQALSNEALLGGELRDASVLFVDLVGSTAMAQRLPPQEVVDVLNEFFAGVVDCVGAEGGWVNKFEGDAALCVFGPPGDYLPHAAGALRAARMIREVVTTLAEAHPGLDAGIGVSSGQVVAGNIGAADRYEYTVIGDPVNEAARLSEEAKCHLGRTLASGAAVLDSDEESVNWVECGSTLLRGRTNPTAMYEPTGHRRTEPAA